LDRGRGRWFFDVGLLEIVHWARLWLRARRWIRRAHGQHRSWDLVDARTGQCFEPLTKLAYQAPMLIVDRLGHVATRIGSLRPKQGCG
jgi:hypothetical protein